MDLVNNDLDKNLTNINSATDYIPLRKIAQEICDKHGIVSLDKRRTDSVSAARYEFFYRALCETTDSPNKISRLIGCDHTTVMYGAGRYALHNGLEMPRGLGFYTKAASAEHRNYPKTPKQKKIETVRKYLKKKQSYETEGEFETRREQSKRGSAALLERLREVHGG